MRDKERPELISGCHAGQFYMRGEHGRYLSSAVATTNQVFPRMFASGDNPQHQSSKLRIRQGIVGAF